jgi:putative heme-binding domain-containing protein
MTRMVASFLVCFALLVSSQVARAADDFNEKEAKPLFDGKSLDGWKGETENAWRVEEGVICAGKLDEVNKVARFLFRDGEHEHFDLKFRFQLEGNQYLNTGMYFRSKRTGDEEIVGPQADIGDGYHGGLYENGRGRGALTVPPADVQKKVFSPGKWNEYRVRAEGNRIRIWFNGTLTTDYIERDRGAARRGVFAIELSPNMKGVIRFKDLRVVDLPATADIERDSLDGPARRIAEKRSPRKKLSPFTNGRFELQPDDVVVTIGSENAVIEQRTGGLEGILATAFAKVKPRFRSMAWEGDTVYRQNRMLNWGSWEENLDAAGATVVFAWFGQLEVLDSTKSIQDFENAYGSLLDTLVKSTPRIVVIGPAPFEKPANPLVVDNTGLNKKVAQYSDVARRLAQARSLVFVDANEAISSLGSKSSLTRNGVHYTPEGSRRVGEALALKMLQGNSSARPKVPQVDAKVRAAIVEKNRVWFDGWRCMNWAFAYGDRTTQPFPTATAEAPTFEEELTKFRPLVAQGDAVIHALTTGTKAPAPLPSPASRPDPQAASPEEEKSRFVVREGFEVELFADESLDVKRPLQIRWDERGRLWVLCAPSYPQLQPGEVADDYLVCIEDTNGDGKGDKSTRVASGLTMPMGFEFDGATSGASGIYICESTQLIHVRDTDNDGVCDERRVVLSGFGTGDSHQNINSIRWGADGCLWFTQGLHIWSYVETPYGLVELNRSGLWRFNPRTEKLDSYLNESQAGLNCWGVTFDDYGQVFHASGADFSVWHTTPALVPTLHPLSLGPGLCVSRGKCMEPEFLGSSHLPPELQGVLLKSIYFTNQIRLYRLSDDGSGYRSDDLGDLIASTGTEFRPLETRVGPDGAIYICDWLNPVIGHYQASYRDPRRDRSHGRIWRMTAKGRELAKRPKLEAMKLPELLAQLESPERWIREHARNLLFRQPKNETLAAADALLARLQSGEADDEALMYQLSSVYAAHEEPRPALVDQLLASSDFRRRAWGTRLLGLWAHRMDGVLARIEKSAADEHPRVRMEAVIAAATIPSAEAAAMATIVMDRPLDFGINYALTQCLHHLAPHWQPALAAGKLNLGARPHALARLLTTVGDGNAVGQVKELLKSGELTPAVRENLLAVLIENGTTDDATQAVAAAPESPVVLDALVAVAMRKRSQGFNAVIDQLIDSPHKAARIAGFRLAGLLNQPRWRDKALAVAKLAENDALERAAAVKAYSSIVGDAAREDLLRWADETSPEMRTAALAGLAILDIATAADKASQLLAPVTTEQQVAAVLEPLLSVKNGPATLAVRLQTNKLPTAAAKAAIAWMNQSGHDHPPILTALYAAADFQSIQLEYSEAIVKQLVEEARDSGDARKGSEIFRSAQSACVRCHKLGDGGGNLGPDLSAIGRAMTPEAVVESVLWPKRQIKEGFALTTVYDNDGRQFQGYKIRESQTELVLRNLTGGPDFVIPKDEIDERNDTGTLMPEGVTGWMTDEQRRNLLRFLLELGKDPALLAEAIAAQKAAGDIFAHKHGPSHGYDPGPAPEPEMYDYPREALYPKWRPYAVEHVNRNRLYDYYTKQALYYKQQKELPKLLKEFPGLDDKRFGHWGNQNETVWKDPRWNEMDLGGLLAGVVRQGEKVIALKGVAVQLGDNGELSACFDPLTASYPMVWSGKFLRFDEFRHGLIHGLLIDGEPVDDDATKAAAKAESRNIEYLGFVRNGKRVVFRYRLDGVEMLDAPWVRDGKFERNLAPADQHPLKHLLSGGAPRWPQVIETQGKLGESKPFACDEIMLPADNPWKSLIFVGDHDFFANGDIAICTAMGDVWIASGIEGDLSHIRWRRFAAGMHQPLGIKVVDGTIHVLGRDQITRLHDRNGDGEADEYECFSNVQTTSAGGHDYICGLQRDAAGDWYFASANQGLCRLSADGKNITVLATGFRNPNGVGLSADGVVTTSVQEGNWTQASQVFAVHSGDKDKYAGFGGPKKGVETMLPLAYFPRGVDNSTGGQCFVDSDGWAYPKGTLLSFSFGTGTAQVLFPETVDGVQQAAVWTLPVEFASGAHRGRFSPKDGQLYVSGMAGWGTYTHGDGCLHRVRLVEDDAQLPLGVELRDNGAIVRFKQPIDAKIAEDPKRHFAQVWNYRYAMSYGSPEFSPTWPAKPGHDPLEIGICRVLEDGRSLFIELPQLQRVNQLHLQVDLGQEPFDLYATVHKQGPAYVDFAGYRAFPKRLVAQGGVVVPPSEPNPWAMGEAGREVKISAATGLRFNIKKFNVKAGERISLTLENPDAMPHNIAITKPGKLAAVGTGSNAMANHPDGGVKQYIPPGGDVLVYTDVIEPGKNFTIHFNAPKEPGEYPYLCTFPGHWQIMNGVMVVE